MNFDFAKKINPDLKRLDFAKAIQKAETALQKLPRTAYHDVLGKPLAGADELAGWIEQFFVKAWEELKIKALYFEMNEFDINTDYWYIDGFAYGNDGKLNPRDMDWLSRWDADTQNTLGSIYVIEGYESLQEAFATEPATKNEEEARDWSEQLIIARYMELMRSAHLAARRQNLLWADVPIYFTEHAYDFIVRSEV